jgi:hypothetical protein
MVFTINYEKLSPEKQQQIMETARFLMERILATLQASQDPNAAIPMDLDGLSKHDTRFLIAITNAVAEASVLQIHKQEPSVQDGPIAY